MRKLLNTLFVTSENAYLSLDGENVVASRDGQEAARYPLHMLSGILSFSYAGASPALMARAPSAASVWRSVRRAGAFSRVSAARAAATSCCAAASTAPRTTPPKAAASRAV